MKSILDPTFKYTNSANTDLRRTFARIRRQQRRQQILKELIHEYDESTQGVAFQHPSLRAVK